MVISQCNYIKNLVLQNTRIFLLKEVLIIMIKKKIRPEVAAAVIAAINAIGMPAVETRVVSIQPLKKPGIWKWAGVFEMMLGRGIKS
jgi:hypothetical protein